MNTTLTTAPGRHDHPPQPQVEQSTRRVGTLDRLAMHLGVALIKWGRRPRRAGWRERRATRYEAHLARVASDLRYGEYISRRAREQRLSR